MREIRVGAKSVWSGLLKTVSFFWRWVNADWTFLWPISYKNQSLKLLDLQSFGFIFQNEYTVLFERAVNVLLLLKTTY